MRARQRSIRTAQRLLCVGGKMQSQVVLLSSGSESVISAWCAQSMGVTPAAAV